MTRKLIVLLLTQGKKEKCDNSQAISRTESCEKLTEKLPGCYEVTLWSGVGSLTYLR